MKGFTYSKRNKAIVKFVDPSLGCHMVDIMAPWLKNSKCKNKVGKHLYRKVRKFLPRGKITGRMQKLGWKG